ncbi:MAG: MFS transporter [Nitrososphaerales archaeon]
MIGEGDHTEHPEKAEIERKDSGSSKDLGLITVAHAETHAQSAVYSVLYPYIMQSLNFDTVELGILVFATSLIGGLLQGVHGFLSRWIRRKNLLGAGNMFIGVTMALSSIANNFPFFSATRIAGGVASSPQHPVAASLMSDWYDKKKRGSAFSVHFAGGNIGTLVGPLAAGLLYVWVGWQKTLLILGLPGIVIGLLVFASLKDERKAGNWFKSKERTNRKSYLAAIHNTQALKLMVARTMTSIGRGLGIVLTYVQLYLVQSLGLHATTAALFITVLAAGSVFSPILGGNLADRIGLRRPVIIGSLILSSVSLWLLVESGKYLPLVFASVLLLGLGVFNEGPLSQALLSDIVADDERDGAFSLYFVVSYAGGAIWGLVIALIIVHYSFAAAFFTIVAANLFACLIYFAVKESKSQSGKPTPVRSMV